MRAAGTDGALLSRQAFKEAVFVRDGHRCVFCPTPAVDAHHILDRKLFPDGGYYLANGASVCAEHHLACERTDISVEEVRSAAGIEAKVMPPGLDADDVYDKWGNAVLDGTRRLPGPLFRDDGARKALAAVMWTFPNGGTA